MNLIDLMDYSGVAFFAATGSLVASRKQLDIIGFLFLAAATGIGGGTFRDVILGATPVFWVVNPTYLLVCVAAALVVFVFAHRLESRYRLLLWLDAMGVSAYCVMGAAKGLAATGSPTVAITTGVLTASFGGILRDLLANEPSVLLRPEIYISAALIGAAVFTAAAVIGAPLWVASMIGIGAAFVVRGGALRYAWRFPLYKTRPGRHPDDVM